MELIPVALIWIIVLIFRASMKKDAQKSGAEKQTDHPNPSHPAGSPSQMTAKQQELARQKAIKKQKEEEWRKSVQRRMEDERREKEQREKEQRQKESILERAKDNAKEVQDAVSVDVISTPAVHHHPEDVLQESMLGSVEDLMVKGYDGKLCFERDFVAEGMDLLNQYTLPSEAI